MNFVQKHSQTSAGNGDKHLLVREVFTKKDLRHFVGLPYRLYRGNPWWIPPLRRAETALFNPEKNPALAICQLKTWLCEKDGRVAGRIGCFINRLETEMTGYPVARFNWLEFEDDSAISAALLETASQWAQAKGAKAIKGPLGFANLDNGGMTVEGFEEMGTVGAPYHHPYYLAHLEKAGFRKKTDYLECVVDKAPHEVPERLQRLRPIIEKKFGVRQVIIKDKKEVEDTVRKFFGLIIETYKQLPSFVPLSPEQIDFYIEQYLPFLSPDYLSIIQDASGNVVGFCVIVPNFSQALKKANSRLFPFGIFHLLRARKHHDAVDFLLIGILEEWRNKGLNALIFSNAIPIFKKQGLKRVFINPILEENQASLALFQDFGPRVFRRRRVFEKDL
jgi:GNAT superfamily N-acetyltransferase